MAPPDRSSPRGAGSLVIAALLVLVGCQGDEYSVVTEADLPGREADAAFERDALPGGYVGNAACADCHGGIAQEYEGTKKNRSLVPFDAEGAPERFLPPEVVHDTLRDLRYEAFLHDGRLVQRETREDEDGVVVHDLEFAADLVIGSGNQTRSYLMARQGRVTQMPLTWYTHRGHWDLSPGYRDANDRFSRKIIAECLNCHSDTPRRTPYTQNHYQDLPGAISCERCHGPGEAHVEARSRDADGGASAEIAEPGEDPSIVNPARLDRDRELSVCAQCHMAGVMAYPPGEGPGTFVPGMHLAEHRTVHVPEQQLTDPDWVGIDSHPVRLARSACFQASEMTCLTCHVPHTPDSDLSDDHYNVQCGSCHAPEDPEPHLCSRPEARTAGEAAEGDCVSCHMPAGGTSDVPHVRFTDHWIQREPGPGPDPDAGRPVIETSDPVELVPLSPRGSAADPDLFRHQSESVRLSVEAEAYYHFWETMHRLPDYVPRVVELGRRSLEAGDGTGEGRLALGRALLEMDSVDAAEEVLRDAVADEPDNPWGHLLLGALLAERRGMPAEAVRVLRRAAELQPELLEVRTKLAEALHADGRVPEAIAELEDVVRRDPVHTAQAWFNLGVLRQEIGEEAAARKAFEEASRLDPDLVDAHVQRGTFALSEGRLADAENAFRSAVAADPEDPGAQGSFALLHLQRGETEAARERLERVLELDPGNQAARTLLEQIPP